MGWRGRKQLRRRHRGLTLIETALSTTIVGVGVVAMMQLLAAGTIANVDGTELTTGMTLARDMREFGLRLGFFDPTTPSTWGLDSGESASNPKTFDDINDLAGRTFDPPIDSGGNTLSGFTGWSQSVTVQSVDPNNLATSVPSGNGSTPANRVTVTINRNGKKVCEMTWYAFDGSP